jgi:AraC-like DNA-binding protein
MTRALLESPQDAFEELRPSPVLRPFVDRLWMRSGAPPEGTAIRILPDGCIDLIVNLTTGGAVVVGTMTRAVPYVPEGPVQLVAVRFRPRGASPFLSVAADELTDRTVDSADVGCRWLELVRFADGSPPAAARTLERALLQRLAGIGTPDPPVVHGVSALFGQAPPSISALARDLGLSRQHLNRIFKRHVGVSPKQLARVARLQRAVARLQQGTGATDLAHTAVGLGYFDQAHMTREFSELAGVTPAVAARSTGSIYPIRSLLE